MDLNIPNTGRTGFGLGVPSFNISVNRRTSDHLSAYSVEMLAIAIASQWIEKVGH